MLYAWMKYYWIGHSLCLTISAGDHALHEKVFNSFTGKKKTLKLSFR